MKKIFLIGAAFFFLSSVAFSAQPTAPGIIPPGASTPSLPQTKTTPMATKENSLKGKIVSINGEVKVKKAGSDSWRDAKANESISMGDEIKTEKNGKVKIVIENGNIVYLKANSALAIKELARIPGGKYTSIFTVNQGKIRAEVLAMKDLERFEVHTPTAVAGVRGTVLFLNVMPGLTQLFVQNGVGFLANPISGEEKNVPAGLISGSDAQGNVAPPKTPDLQQQQDIQENWEPVEIPGLTDINTGDVVNQNDSQDENKENADEDANSSQDAEKTQYISNPPSTAAADSDNDGIPDTIEAQIGSCPNTPDTDADGSSHFPSDSTKAAIDDFYDAFPNTADHSSDTTVFGSMTDIRDARELIIRDYADDSTVPRSEIAELVSETRERERDAIIDRITDAQIHKVLTDINGYRVRMEEYIFRPTNRKIVCLNLCLRTAEASTLSGITSLLFEVEFYQDINSLSYSQIKNFDWDDFFVYESEAYYDHAPTYYPANAFMLFTNPAGGTCKFNRAFSGLESCSPPYYYQTATNTISINGGSAVSTYIDAGSTPANPSEFSFWNGESLYYATVQVHQIDENGQHAGSSFLVSDIFEDVVTGGDFNDVGYLYEIQIWAPSTPSSSAPSTSGTPDFDLIYMPPGDVPEYP